MLPEVWSHAGPLTVVRAVEDGHEGEEESYEREKKHT